MAETLTAAPASSSANAKTVLEVRDLQAWYGESHILHGVNFDVKQGEVVTLLGRNGAGKTTTLKSIMGIIGKRTGSVKFEGNEIIKASSDKIAKQGIAFCPVCTENLNPDVVVMQSAKDGMRFDTSGRLNWARDRRIFV